jgi:hypothetical protein
MSEYDKYTVVDATVLDRLLADGRVTQVAGTRAKEREAARLAGAERNVQRKLNAIERDMARLAGAARRKAGPSATLKALQVGQSHTFEQYHVRTQIATLLGRVRATFVCTSTADGLRVERTK